MCEHKYSILFHIKVKWECKTNKITSTLFDMMRYIRLRDVKMGMVIIIHYTINDVASTNIYTYIYNYIYILISQPDTGPNIGHLRLDR